MRSPAVTNQELTEQDHRLVLDLGAIWREASVSRRDRVKVAWHEVPGMVREKRPVPWGRYDLLPAGRITNIGLAMRYYLSSDRSGLTDDHPVPPGRVRLAYLSRHFVPGYLHLVPTGHRPYRYPVLQQSPRLLCLTASRLNKIC
jgi:hypothetical protein